MYGFPGLPFIYKKPISERQKAHLVKARASRRRDRFLAAQAPLDLVVEVPGSSPPPYNNRGTRNNLLHQAIFCGGSDS